MMPGAEFVLFALGARLHKSAAEIERLSAREIAGWLDFFTPPPGGGPAANDDVPEVASLSKAQLRSMFHHGR
jgi:hypothetical protein